MRLGIISGALCSAPLIVGCGHKDEAVHPSDAGARYVPGDQFQGDASNPGLVGGLYTLSPDVLDLIRTFVCDGSTSDGGAYSLVGEDGGTCTIPFPTGQGSYGKVPDINVVWTVDPSQSILIGESTSDCSAGDGWYLDSNVNIILCPQTCSKVNTDAGASIQAYADCIPMCMICSGG